MARELDIMSVVPGLSGTETFAAVHPRDNGKLAADFIQSAARAETHRYAFYLSPAVPGTCDRGSSAELMFQEDLGGRILPFVDNGAVHHVKLVTARRDAGTPIETFDALIAATTLAAGAGSATRDVGGFAGCGLSLVNPWEAA